MKRPLLLYPLFILHLFLGLGALFGGGSLVLQPDGSGLGMNTGWLARSPFSNYLVPGLLLFFFMGLLPLVSAIGLFFRPDWPWFHKLNLYSDRHWSWAFSIYSGLIVIVWITVQLILTQYFWLQPVMIFTGLLILVFTLTPPVMARYRLAMDETSKNKI